MFHYIANLASHTSEDSLVHIITDWIALGCYTRFWKSEGCSDHHDSFAMINDPSCGDCLTVLTIIASNFSFATES